MTELQTLLASNPYPGRGVLCARTRSGAVSGGYFLTGRSAASKDRVLRVDGDELVAGPITPAEHDPLRYYTAALSTAGWLVFGNGEQVAQVTERLRKTLTVQDLEPGEAVLMTTYHSDGQSILTATPFGETTITAHDGTDLLEEIWSALNPEFRIAAAVLDPGQGPAGAVLRSA